MSNFDGLFVFFSYLQGFNRGDFCPVSMRISGFSVDFSCCRGAVFSSGAVRLVAIWDYPGVFLVVSPDDWGVYSSSLFSVSKE